MTVSLSGRGVGHSFGDLTVLDGLDFEARPGEVLGLVGPSGCGKSTLLELIGGLRQPDRGRIEIDGKEGEDARLERCAWMPQKDCLLPWYTALDNAGLALRNLGRSKGEARAEAGLLFDRFGLAGFEQSRPDQLSGGMRQRVAFLRTLVSRKDVLLLDEPFASLDAITRAELQEWLLPVLDEKDHTVVLVTHDVEEALYLSDAVLALTSRPGRVAASMKAPSTTGFPREQVVTDPGFTERREELLALLRQSSPSIAGGAR
ncbi:MAG: ABC transporter ATP-binding protein [Thermoleophilia bacterium]|nr:ABC transporter ATP-binding protein [Thermoleophilia bacterium]